MSDYQPTHRRTLSGRRVPLADGRPRTWHEIVRRPARSESRRRNTPHDNAMRRLPSPASLRTHVTNDFGYYDASVAPGRPVEFHGPNRARLRDAGKRGGHRKPSLAVRRTTFKGRGA